MPDEPRPAQKPDVYIPICLQVLGIKQMRDAMERYYHKGRTGVPTFSFAR